jgi:hypothetical protein
MTMTAASRNLDPTIVLQPPNHRPDLHIAILPKAAPLARERNLTDVGQRVSTPTIVRTYPRVLPRSTEEGGATKHLMATPAHVELAATSCNGVAVVGFSCPPNAAMSGGTATLSSGCSMPHLPMSRTHPKFLCRPLDRFVGRAHHEVSSVLPKFTEVHAAKPATANGKK